MVRERTLNPSILVRAQGGHPKHRIIMKIITEYTGDKNHQDRSAHIYEDSDGLKVECYVQGHPVKLIDVGAHSLYYAEDTAENWVTGILN